MLEPHPGYVPLIPKKPLVTLKQQPKKPVVTLETRPRLLVMLERHLDYTPPTLEMKKIITLEQRRRKTPP